MDPSDFPVSHALSALFTSLGFVYYAVVVLISHRQVAGSRKRKLRQLYAITTLVNAGLPPQFKEINDQLDEEEARFLDENDIIKCVYCFLFLS